MPSNPSFPSRDIGSSSFTCDIFGILAGHVCGHFVAQVKEKTVAQGQAAARGNRVVTDMRLVLESLVIVLAERVRAKEPVVACHPPGGMAQVLRMVENRHAIDPAIVRRMVVAPVSPLAPRGGIAQTCARHEVAV